ncbi:hypothetical protein KC19_1G000600 [Ceratodon purpureus]|uniref:Uncharacterized protein n=1 Tax=Ceratodon purpureus TaxID=3225 RepID=A0A8T0J210_CERPU|nr:hypothetical protein KC19_1G000600 [Ceratodon purpureus]
MWMHFFRTLQLPPQLQDVPLQMPHFPVILQKFPQTLVFHFHFYCPCTPSQLNLEKVECAVLISCTLEWHQNSPSWNFYLLSEKAPNSRKYQRQIVFQCLI